MVQFNKRTTQSGRAGWLVTGRLLVQSPQCRGVTGQNTSPLLLPEELAVALHGWLRRQVCECMYEPLSVALDQIKCTFNPQCFSGSNHDCKIFTNALTIFAASGDEADVQLPLPRGPAEAPVQALLPRGAVRASPPVRGQLPLRLEAPAKEGLPAPVPRHPGEVPGGGQTVDPWSVLDGWPTVKGPVNPQRFF